MTTTHHIDGTGENSRWNRIYVSARDDGDHEVHIDAEGVVLDDEMLAELGRVCIRRALDSASASIDDLIEQFNEKHDVGVTDQTVKLYEEGGEVAEAVGTFTGSDAFKPASSADEVGDEVADVLFTARSLALAAGVDDIDGRLYDVTVGNLDRGEEGE